MACHTFTGFQGKNGLMAKTGYMLETNTNCRKDGSRFFEVAVERTKKKSFQSRKSQD